MRGFVYAFYTRFLLRGISLIKARCANLKRIQSHDVKLLARHVLNVSFNLPDGCVSAISRLPVTRCRGEY